MRTPARTIDNFSFSEVTAGWGAGGGSNCTGVSITSYSTTQFTFTFGNGYGNGGSPDEYGALGYGDSFDVNMLGTTFNGSVPAYSPTPTISSVAITGSLFNPTVTVTGSGFGTEDDLGSPVPAYCGNTGFDYDNNFSLTDGWGAGLGSGPFGDCTGVSISSYSDTHVTFTFGNGYGNGNGQYGSLSSGDSFQMNVLGADFNGTVPTLPPTIDGVTFGGDPTNPTVTVSGSGFGTLADLGSQSDPDGGGSGWDYGNNFYFSDLSGSWQAGQSPDYVGAGHLGLLEHPDHLHLRRPVLGVRPGEERRQLLDGLARDELQRDRLAWDGLHLHRVRHLGHQQLPGGGVRVPGSSGQHR